VTRSLAKTLSYRVVIFALLTAITYYYTGDVGQTTVISIAFNVSGALVYYLFERLWNAVTWGKRRELRAASPQTYESARAGLALYQIESSDPNAK
jgi:uncharacterized membrane protein